MARWDLADPTAPKKVDETDESVFVVSLVVSPDGSTLAAGRNDSEIQLYDLAGPPKLQTRGDRLDGHAEPVLSVRFTADSRRLFSAGADARVQVWDVGDRQQSGRADPLRHARARRAQGGSGCGRL